MPLSNLVPSASQLDCHATTFSYQFKALPRHSFAYIVLSSSCRRPITRNLLIWHGTMQCGYVQSSMLDYLYPRVVSGLNCVNSKQSSLTDKITFSRLSPCANSMLTQALWNHIGSMSFWNCGDLRVSRSFSCISLHWGYAVWKWHYVIDGTMINFAAITQYTYIVDMRMIMANLRLHPHLPEATEIIGHILVFQGTITWQ